MTMGQAIRRYARRGDPAAFAAVVEAYGQMVYGVCRRLLPTAQDAEDATQECFLTLARQAGRVKRNVPAWLHRCATNHCLDVRRQAASRAAREQAYAGEQAMRMDAAGAAAGGSADGELTWQEVAPRIDEALGHLPEPLQVVLIEHYLRRRSQPEIARALGVSTATVSRRCKEGLAGVRAELERMGVASSVAGVMAALEALQTYELPAKAAAGLSKLSIAGIGAAVATGVVVSKTVIGVVAAVVAALSLIGWYTVSHQNQWHTRALLRQCSAALHEYSAAHQIDFARTHPYPSFSVAPLSVDMDSQRYSAAITTTRTLLWEARDTVAGRAFWASLPNRQREKFIGTAAFSWRPGTRFDPGDPVVIYLDRTPIYFLCTKQQPEHPPLTDAPVNPDYWMPITTPSDVPVVLDAWGNPVVFVPGGELRLTGHDAGDVVVRSPDGRSFFASGGPDGDLRTGGDNVYSF